MTICDSVKYIGVDDHEIDLFEGQFEVPGGMAYNSYAVVGQKVCVMDSVDANFVQAWLGNIEAALGSKAPDFLVVQHMEMDHSAGVLAFAKKYPEAKIVSSKMAFAMMKNMFEEDFSDRQIVVSDGSELDLGGKKLKFISAPNVHWPEVVMTYDEADKILFSADAFGKFGALDYDDPEGWDCEARRYYFGIVGKFGDSVQALLKKAAAFDIQKICPLHGPVLDKDLGHYIEQYNTWSSYGVESPGVAVAYASVYGHTREAAQKLAQILKEKGCTKVALFDLAREDIYECVEDAFRYGTLVIASPTYNGGAFPAAREFIQHLTSRNYQKRKVAFIENGSWAPAAAKAMAAMFEQSQEITFAQTKVSIKIAMKDADIAALESLAEELLAR